MAMHEDGSSARDSFVYELTSRGKPNQEIGKIDIFNRNSQMSDTRFRYLSRDGIVTNGYNMCNPAFC